MITLRQLRYLAALAEHRHFGRAAEACSVTQPALSMQIRDLERFLGVELVERRPGDVVLTRVGVEVAERGERMLAAARDLVDVARHSGRVLSGRLMLGIIPSLAPYVLPKILPALQQLILLEEGHCLRDQALAYCADSRRGSVGNGSLGLGATSLATVMQMVANGYGVTLVPEVAIDVEVRDERVKLLRFAPPVPGRTIGLAWRHTSPRKVDFVALGQIVTE